MKREEQSKRKKPAPEGRKRSRKAQPAPEEVEQPDPKEAAPPNPRIAVLAERFRAMRQKRLRTIANGLLWGMNRLFEEFREWFQELKPDGKGSDDMSFVQSLLKKQAADPEADEAADPDEPPEEFYEAMLELEAQQGDDFDPVAAMEQLSKPKPKSPAKGSGDSAQEVELPEAPKPLPEEATYDEAYVIAEGYMGEDTLGDEACQAIATAMVALRCLFVAAGYSCEGLDTLEDSMEGD